MYVFREVVVCSEALFVIVLVVLSDRAVKSLELGSFRGCRPTPARRYSSSNFNSTAQQWCVSGKYAQQYTVLRGRPAPSFDG